MGKPESAAERQRKQLIFVNKRSITNKSISFAVKNAYGSLIPKNTYPPYVLLIDVPPNTIDVNVHPRKEEVKFTDEKIIFDGVKTAVKQALDRVNLTPGSAKVDPFGDPFGAPPFGGAAPGFGTGFGSKAPMPNARFGGAPKPFAPPLGNKAKPAGAKPFPSFPPMGAKRLGKIWQKTH